MEVRSFVREEGERGWFIANEGFGALIDLPRDNGAATLSSEWAISKSPIKVENKSGSICHRVQENNPS